MKLLYIASALLAIVGATDVDSIDNTNPTNRDINEDNHGKLLLHARFSDNPKKGVIFSDNDKISLAKRKIDEQELIRRQSYHQRNAQNPDAVFNKPESGDEDSKDDDGEDSEDDDDDDDDEDCEDDEEDDEQPESPAAEMRQDTAEPANAGTPTATTPDNMIPSITPSITPSVTPSMVPSMTPSITPGMPAGIPTVTETATPAINDDDDDDDGYYGGAPNGGNCRCCCGGGGPGFGYGPQIYPGYLMGGGMMMNGMMNPYPNMQQGGFPGGGPYGYYNQYGGQRMQGQGGYPGQGYQNGYGQIAQQAPILEVTETIQSIGYQTILVTEDIPTGQEAPAYTSVPPSGGYPPWGNQNADPQNNPVSYVYVPYTVTVTDTNGGNGQIGMPNNNMAFGNNMPTNMPGLEGPTPTNGANNGMDSQTPDIPVPPTIYLGTVGESNLQPSGEDATGLVQPFGEDDTGSVKPFGGDDTGSAKPFGGDDTGSVKPFGGDDTGSAKPFGGDKGGSAQAFGEEDAKPTKTFGEDDTPTDSGNNDSVLFIE